MALRSDRIDTLGCNGLEMLRKLANINAIDILDEDSHVHNGIDCAYRIKARVMDGLYIEAYDPLNELLTLPERQYYITTNVTTATPAIIPSNQEVLDWSAHPVTPPNGNTDFYYSMGLRLPDLTNLAELGNFPVIAPSVMYTVIRNDPQSTTVFPNIKGDIVGGCSLAHNFNLSGPIQFSPAIFTVSSPGAFTGNHDASVRSGSVLPFGLTNPSGAVVTIGGYGSVRVVLSSGVRSNFTPFDGRAGLFSYQAAYPPVTTLGLMGMPVSGVALCDVHISSGAIIRVASSIDGSGNLINPTSWVNFALHSNCVAVEGGGLFFMHMPVGSNTQYGGILHISLLDTTKGNNFGDGKTPVILRTNGVAGGEAGYDNLTNRVIVSGTETGPSGSKRMSTYSATIPIGADVLGGGPVVSNYFAMGLDEIRGAFPAMLACQDSLPLGTSGWLDGHRYTVIMPGIMARSS